ncbi:hypothetical protein HaLaN_14595 [Haematococcus lacustris]|uniref:Uncharacterized protein n=1 Tax=Haematococcus lacustris TaxID=44745 RepID=A0A699Z8H8_HAELA|nr:hypothetical protein HaLaN_14595 [Haematococcus lacustris]
MFTAQLFRLAVGLPAALVPAAMAADNIAMAVFLALLMVYPEGSRAGHNSVQNGSAASASRTTLPVTPESLALSLGAAACACSCGHALAHALTVPSLHLLAMTLVAASAAPVGSVEAAAVTTAALVPGSCISGQQPAIATSPFAGASQLSGLAVAWVLKVPLRL